MAGVCSSNGNTSIPICLASCKFSHVISVGAATQKRFLTAGARLFSSTPAEAAAFAAKETAMWREVVRLSGLTPQ